MAEPHTRQLPDPEYLEGRANEVSEEFVRRRKFVDGVVLLKREFRLMTVR
ncbi:MAG: hypothetical protein PHI74_07805 [Methanocellales archaeon]|nr:hypothetical protein [Methanocellales archaeon]MDD3292442.1 hypothetical protein [Methanocellales archaeon]MDD5485913.1 hypothetical protein [Methanocellales archaeon]